LVYVLYTLYIIACVFLILVVLLQSGKGGDVAAAFGGAGSQTAFGPRGAQKPLEKATVTAAVLFMVLALIFSLPGVTGPRSVITEKPIPSQPSPSPGMALPAAAPSMSVNPAAPASPAASQPALPAGGPSASPQQK
jgi:preprotein translocase subunit SecG